MVDYANQKPSLSSEGSLPHKRDPKLLAPGGGDLSAEAAPATGGLVWLEDGLEKKAPEHEEPFRPWLEESAEWGSGRDKDDVQPQPEDTPEDGQKLIWL